MTKLERAIETTQRIRDALAGEIELAREERVLIRNMDVEGLNRRTARRADFNQRTAQLQRTLAADLADVALALGLQEVTLEGLNRREPTLGEKMSLALAEVRALAGALSELDNLNQMLGHRALSYVRAHMAVLNPKPSAYDRRGGASTDSRATTVVRVL